MTKECSEEDRRRKKEMQDIQRQVVAALFVSVLAVVPTLWMLMDRSPPYIFEYAEIIPNVVPQGGEIHIEFTVIQNRANCGPGVIYHEYKEASGKLHLYDPVHHDDVNDIVNNKFSRIEKLPDGISVGTTIYRGTDCYTCNPVQSLLRWPVCASTPNLKFTVKD